MNKIDIVNGAYSQMRISGLTVQATAEDVELALSRLESMMSELEGRNVTLGYLFEEVPTPNTSTGVARKYRQMMETNLAIRLTPDFNKTPNQGLVMQAMQAMSSASSMVASERARETSYPSRQPRGSTSRTSHYQRFYNKGDQPPINPDSINMIIGDIDDFTERFTNYLGDNEVIASYTIESDSLLTIVSSSNTDSLVLYRVEATSSTHPHQEVKIVVTTDGGRVETRIISFNIKSDDI